MQNSDDDYNIGSYNCYTIMSIIIIIDHFRNSAVMKEYAVLSVCSPGW